MLARPSLPTQIETVLAAFGGDETGKLEAETNAVASRRPARKLVR